MTYEETIDYLFKALPMFSRMGSAALKKDLVNIRLLCALLDHPEKTFPSIHIAGTNGKGSVSHMLASILQASGYKTGLYTSPHLYDFRERIRLDGGLIDKEFITLFVKKIKPTIDRIQPSFFEITVAMAFHYFSVQKADVAVIEVGLGGKLDSTNIIVPLLSVITNIGWDHMNILGNSLEEIAAEKAGIIKEYVPVVIGEKSGNLHPLFQKVALEHHAEIFYADDEYEAKGFEWNDEHFTIHVSNKNGPVKNYALDLHGIYQKKNICTVLKAVDVLRSQGLVIPEDSVHKALSQVKKNTGLQGRWETIRQHPAVVLEVAHNKEGIEQMVAHLRYKKYNRLHIVLGIVKDKEPELVLEQLPKDAVYYFTKAQIPRALEPELLRASAEQAGLNGTVFPEVNAAVQAALASAKTDDLIIVCGSIFLAAEVDRVKITSLSPLPGVPKHI